MTLHAHFQPSLLKRIGRGILQTVSATAATFPRRRHVPMTRYFGS